MCSYSLNMHSVTPRQRLGIQKSNTRVVPAVLAPLVLQSGCIACVYCAKPQNTVVQPLYYSASIPQISKRPHDLSRHLIIFLGFSACPMLSAFSAPRASGSAHAFLKFLCSLPLGPIPPSCCPPPTARSAALPHPHCTLLPHAPPALAAHCR